MGHISIKQQIKKTIMRIKSILVITMFINSLSVVHAGIIKVVTTTTDMKSIAELVGGDKVSVK